MRAPAAFEHPQRLAHDLGADAVPRRDGDGKAVGRISGVGGSGQGSHVHEDS